jgi:hypothetical protein
MCRRSLSVLIASALLGAGAVAAQNAPPAGYDRPPPAAAASVEGGTFPATQIPPCPQETRAEQQARIERGQEAVPCPPESPVEGSLAHADSEMYPELEHGPPERGTAAAAAAVGPAEDGEPLYRDPDERTATAAAAVGPADEAARHDRMHQDERDARYHDEHAVARPADPVDYAEQPIAAAELDPDEVEIRSAEGEPFAETAGTEGFSAGATAQTAAQRFRQLDRDGSGELTRENVEGTELAQRFEEYDINNDGVISENEFQSWFAAQRDVADTDLDTAIATADERDERDEAIATEQRTAAAAADTRPVDRTEMTAADPAAADRHVYAEDDELDEDDDRP